MQSFALTLDTTLGRALLLVAARQMGASIRVTRLLRCYGNCSFGLHTNAREHIKIYSVVSSALSEAYGRWKAFIQCCTLKPGALFQYLLIKQEDQLYFIT